MRYFLAGCLGVAFSPILIAAIAWIAVTAYADPRVGNGEHFPIPTYPISLH